MSTSRPRPLRAAPNRAAVTAKAHLAAMNHTRVGGTEQELAGIVTGIFAQHGCVAAYNNILSIRGEVLHNNHHGNVLRDGDILLLDAGAESATGLAGVVEVCLVLELRVVGNRVGPQAVDQVRLGDRNLGKFAQHDGERESSSGGSLQGNQPGPL